MPPTRPEHSPAIRGVAQVMQRCDDPREALAPLDLIERALRQAAQDAGAPKALSALDALVVPRSVWGYSTRGAPALALAERIGAHQALCGTAVISGTSILEAFDWACEEIAAGRRELIAIAAGECEHSKRRARSRGIDLARPKLEARDAAFELGGSRPEGMIPHELKVGIRAAPHGFALCETSLRRSLGEAPEAHRERIARIWEQLSRVASNNPAAWIQRAVGADEIVEASAENRVVAWPYTKLMTANMVVDQASAILVASEAAAARHGMDVGRSIHPQANTLAAHVVPLSQRDRLHEHAGQTLATQRALELAKIDGHELDAIDLYSCFPFAIQVGANALGIDPHTGEPPLTVTGGLTFGGGPLNNYVLQSLAATVERLRARPGHALVTAIGGYFAKFAACVLANEAAPGNRPASADLSDETARTLRTRITLDDYRGEVEIEAFTLIEDGDGARRSLFATLTERGERVWGRSTDPALESAILRNEELCGLRARIGDDSMLELG